jgi:hypothetical protein
VKVNSSGEFTRWEKRARAMQERLRGQQNKPPTREERKP